MLSSISSSLIVLFVISFIIPGSIIEFEIWNSKEDETKKFAAKVLVVEVPEERHTKY